MMEIYYIEDDENIATAVKEYLCRKGSPGGDGSGVGRIRQGCQDQRYSDPYRQSGYGEG